MPLPKISMCIYKTCENSKERVVEKAFRSFSSSTGFEEGFSQEILASCTGREGWGSLIGQRQIKAVLNKNSCVSLHTLQSNYSPLQPCTSFTSPQAFFSLLAAFPYYCYWSFASYIHNNFCFISLLFQGFLMKFVASQTVISCAKPLFLCAS